MKIRVLGPLELEGNGPPPRPKERAILTILALNPGATVSLDRLVDSLWGDTPPRTATHTIQGYISRLRGLIGEESISAHEGGYRLDEPPDEVDASVFERLANDSRTDLECGDAAGAVALSADALALWRGDPGRELVLGSSGAADAIRLVELHRAVEELWGEAVLRAGLHAEHLHELERMARAEPLREIRWELLMVALYRSGRQGDALRAYGRAREGLVEGLGIEPGPSLRSLEESILLETPEIERRFAPGANALDMPLPPMLEPSGPFGFVGREAERVALHRAWDDASDGVRMVLVTGDAGVGKSRLVAEVAAELHSRGATVLAGRCDEDLNVPYQPFAEAVWWFASHVRDGGAAMFGGLAGELRRLEPRLPRVIADLPEADVADGDIEQYRLFDAVASWLAAVGVDAPVCLVLEDLHWATRPTGLLLHHLLRSAEPRRLLVVGTFRGAEIGRGDPLTVALGDLRREATVEHLALRGLGEADLVSFVESAAGSDLGDRAPELARVVHAGTEGNPLFAGELLRHFAESGATHAPDGWRDAETVLAEIGIPPAVHDVVRGRVSRLSSDAGDVLDAAAVAGSEVEAAVLADAVDLGSRSLVDALDETTSSGLLAEVTGVPVSYRFTHALVQAALYDELSIARRAAAHLRVAEAIQRVHGSNLEDHAAALAHHHGEAAIGSDTRTAVEYATLAGDRAEAQAAHDEAARWYDRALVLLGRDERPGHERRCDLLIALGDVQRRAADPAHRETLLAAAALAQELDDGDRLARAALANYRGFASRVNQVDPDKVRVLQAALTAVGPADSSQRARLLIALGMETASVHDECMYERADEAVAIARRVGDPTTLLDALCGADMTYPRPDGVDLRPELTAEMVELAAKVDDPRPRWQAYAGRSTAAWMHGALDEQERMLDECDRIAAESRVPTLRWNTLVLRASVPMLRGNIEEATTAAEDALQFGVAIAEPDAFDWHRGQWLATAVERDEIPADFEVSDDDVPIARAAHAWGLAQVGEDAKARAELRQTLTSLAGDLVTAEQCWPLLADAAALTGDQDVAARLYDLMLPWDGRVLGMLIAPLGPAGLSLGLLATALGRHADAERHLDDCEALCVRMGARSYLARTELAFARLLIGRDGPGDRDRARDHLTRCLAVAAEHGYRTVERQGSGLLAELVDAG